MRALDFFGLDGETYRLARLADRRDDAWEAVEEREAIAVLERAIECDDVIVALAQWHAQLQGSGSDDHHPPAATELVAWASRELARPTGLLALLRAPRTRPVVVIRELFSDSPLLSELAGAEPKQEHTWVAFRLLDLHGEPIPDVRYQLTLGDGSVQEGTTDGDGQARHDGIVRGGCVLVFPDLPERYWESAHNSE